MNLYISDQILQQIHSHGEASYPEEGAGLLLGKLLDSDRIVTRLLTFSNVREAAARRNRYLLAPQDYLHGEQEAERLGLELIGVYHSHPDHPNQPSEFDREWAMPWLSYIITSVISGKAAGSRSWLLREDRSGFEEQSILSSRF